jgi:hypothetical protein
MACAAALRLHQLDAIDVRFDEASAPQQAREIAHGALRVVSSFSGSVANHPPLYLYLLALPYLFTDNFLAIAAYRQLVEVAAVGLTWLVARRYFNGRVALIAALLFAFAPWAIQLSRKLWLALPPLFTVIWLLGVCQVTLRRDARGWITLGVGLALCLGAHLSAVYLLPATAVAIVVGWRTLRVRPVLIGLAPLIALAAVYVGYDAANGFPNLRAVLAPVGPASSTAGTAFQLLAPQMALWTTGGAHLSDLTSGAYPQWAAQLSEQLSLIDSAQMGLIAASCAVVIGLLLTRRIRGGEAAFWVVVLTWQLVPIGLMTFAPRPPQLHYFIVLWPGAWLMLAWVLDHAASRAPMALYRLGAFAIALIVAWQGFTTVRFVDFVQRYDTALGGYGDPVRAALAVADAARAGVRSGRYRDVIVIVPRDDPRTDEPATVLDVVLADVPRRFVRADNALILRAEPAQYLFAPDTDAARDRLLAHTPTRHSQFVIRPDTPRRYALIEVGSIPLPDMRPADARWANGARLIGYTVARDATKLSATVYVRIDAEGAPNQHWFLRAMNADGRQLGSQDIPGVATAHWRVGDVMALTFAFALSGDDPRTLRIGSYAYPEITQTRVVDAVGNPIDDGVTVSIPDP